jgi:hypothetical protein
VDAVDWDATHVKSTLGVNERDWSEPITVFQFSPKITYPNLTACSSGPEAKDMHVLDTIWKETLWSLWKCQINVGEYNTLDLVKGNTNKKTTVYILFFGTITFEMQEKGPNAVAQMQFQFWPIDCSSVCATFYTDSMNHCISVQNVVLRLPKCA